MTPRLQAELQRLYPVPLAPPPAAGEAPPTRVLILQLGRPADWTALAAVWQGVQADLGLPAPAIAVAGRAGYQLWFSCAAPLPPAQGLAFLEALCRRYLAEIAPARLGLLLAPAAALPPAPLQDDGAAWSAFVAPGLAPVFGDEPWLDNPPNAEGQADLLSGLLSMPVADFERALQRLQPANVLAAAPSAAEAAPGAAALAGGPWNEPRAFLLAVMNDAGQAMSLRIAAAQALLMDPAAPR